MTTDNNKRILNAALFAAFNDAPAATFAVTTSGVGTGVIPNGQYPYEGQKPQARPLLSATVAQPNLTDGRPLHGAVHGSFANGAATGTEGAEPAVDVTFTVAAGPVLTPGSINGKAVITREAYDSLSTPRTADEVGRLLRDAFLDVAETRVAAALDADTHMSEIELTAAASDDVLEGDLLTASAALDVLRGGPGMTSVAGPSLFGDMVEAKGADGHRLGKYTAGIGVELAGRNWTPAWALTAASGATGYVFAPGAVVTRVSIPTVRDVSISVETVELHLFGYSVSEVVRPGDARRVVFA